MLLTAGASTHMPADPDHVRAKLAAIIESSEAAIVSTDPAWVVESWNPAAERLFGYAAEEMLGHSILDLVPPAQHTEARSIVERIRAGEHIAPYHAARLRKDGRLVHVSVNPWPVRDAAGNFVSLAAVYTDLTDRRRAAEALRERDELLRNIMAHIPCGLFWKDRRSAYLGANEQFARDHGLASPEQAVGRTDPDFLVDPSEAEFFRQCDRQVIESGEPLLNVEEPLTRPNGRKVVLLTSKVPLRDAEGRVVGVLGVYQDITDRKRMEEQFRQAQKMDAIGQLAGGIAHDFNNLLTVILGYGDLALERLAADDPLRELVAGMAGAGQRAAALTRQLLAFGRRQVLSPKVLDLNDIVAGIERMLRRLIGEDIDLATRLQPDLGHVRADPGQVEQVLLNLAVNARDAMPRGGKLTIETRDAELDSAYTRGHPEVPPGRYVLMAVSDTGCGMTPEVKARIFEPFFTTKGPGKGTGLGLATVYGIVKQSGGSVEVYSEPDNGTAFKVYLPRVDLPVTAGKSQPPLSPPRGTETILVAEDDRGVRGLTCHVLRSSGYTVLEAADGEDALRAAGRYPGPIHLLLTDVVMPGMNGRELAERLHVTRPHVRVLYLSGYTDDAIVRHGVLEERAEFLQKPFTPLALTSRIRKILDRTD